MRTDLRSLHLRRPVSASTTSESAFVVEVAESAVVATAELFVGMVGTGGVDSESKSWVYTGLVGRPR